MRSRTSRSIHESPRDTGNPSRLLFLAVVLAALGYGAIRPAFVPAEEQHRVRTDVSRERFEAVVVAPVIQASRVETFDELRIDTQRKTTLADGTYNDLYVMKTPAEGNVFLHLALDIASEVPLSYTRDDVALRRDPKTVHHPVSWFLNDEVGRVWLVEDDLYGPGVEPAREVTVESKGTLEVTFDVPREGMESLVLYVGAERIGAIGVLRAQTAVEG